MTLALFGLGAKGCGFAGWWPLSVSAGDVGDNGTDVGDGGATSVGAGEAGATASSLLSAASAGIGEAGAASVTAGQRDGQSSWRPRSNATQGYPTRALHVTYRA